MPMKKKEQRLKKIRLVVPRPSVTDVYQETFKKVSSSLSIPFNGAEIAITVGSRGIRGIDLIAKATVDAVKAKGGNPFVVAAMGSHGKGTIQGQIDVLKAYSVTEEKIGCPVCASDRVYSFDGKNFDGKVHINEKAWNSDGIIVLNRVKKHTDIHGEHESGLLKMISIGLGYIPQATILHKNGMDSLAKNMVKIAQDVLNSGKIILGIGIVENAYGETAKIDVCKPTEMVEKDKELLAYSKSLSFRLPVDRLDVLAIDEGGKDKSGSCIETNIIGRMQLGGEKELTSPQIDRIVVFRLSEGSHGNAAGIGLADFITRKFYNSIDFNATYINCIVPGVPERGKLPIVSETDRAAFDACIATSRHFDEKNPRIIRIHDTNNLEYMLVSDAVYQEIKEKGEYKVELVSDDISMFDDDDSIVGF